MWVAIVFLAMLACLGVAYLQGGTVAGGLGSTVMIALELGGGLLVVGLILVFLRTCS